MGGRIVKFSQRDQARRLNFDWAATVIVLLTLATIAAGTIWILNMLLDKVFGRGG